MTTIVEFLTARIAEDEAMARAAQCEYVGCPWVAWDDNVVPCNPRAPVAQTLNGLVALHIARHDPARVLRECAAKRALVYTLGGGGPIDDTVRNDLAPLAAVYADHPDYDEAWRV